MSDIRQLMDGTRPPRSDLEAKFRDTLQAHPEIYRHFKRFTRDLINRGYKNGSAGDVVGRIRWETMMKPTDPGIPGVAEPLKINNNLYPYLGRLFMEDHPEHAGFFRTRKVKGDDLTPEPTWGENGQGAFV